MVGPDGQPLGNTAYGVVLLDGATGNTVGGTAAGAGNVVSGNSLGVAILGAGSTGNSLLGNRIGTDTSGTLALGNFQSGVFVNNAPGNRIGTAGAGGNLISGNLGEGVRILGSLATATLVQGNVVGLGADGRRLGNSLGGVVIDGSAGNLVGGSGPGEHNVISGNGGSGVAIQGALATGNAVAGNRIGTDDAGRVALGNTLDGITITDASGNHIGAPGSGANVISGNGTSGVQIVGAGATGNDVLGNLIGTDGSGTIALGNALSGVFLNRTTGNVIGSAVPGASNVIAANALDGVRILRATGNVVQGNRIGTDAGGTIALGNLRNGVSIEGADSNLIGGGDSGAWNVISGNAGAGVGLDQAEGVVSHGNVVQGNRIGTDASGLNKLGNGNGVAIEAATGTVLAGDLISGNLGGGVTLAGGDATNGNLIIGCIIGADGSGTSPLGNDFGVILDGVSGNTIGGAGAGQGNVISGNSSAGVDVTGRFASGNHILGNFIGTDRTGARALVPPDRAGAQSVGVLIDQAPASATPPAHCPAILWGGPDGARATSCPATSSASSSRASVPAATSFKATSSARTRAALDPWVIPSGFTSMGPPGIPSAAAARRRNVISGNTSVGIEVYGSTATENMVQGNIVGLAADGRTAFTASKSGFLQPIGVGVRDASSNTITGNVISGQNVAGVYVFSSAAITRGNVIRANRIGPAMSGKRGPGNRLYGVLLYNAADNTVDRQGGFRNVFFGNGIADFREFTGPVPGTRASGPRNRAAAAQVSTPGRDGSARSKR